MNINFSVVKLILRIIVFFYCHHRCSFDSSLLDNLFPRETQLFYMVGSDQCVFCMCFAFLIPETDIGTVNDVTGHAFSMRSMTRTVPRTRGTDRRCSFFSVFSFSGFSTTTTTRKRFRSHANCYIPSIYLHGVAPPNKILPDTEDTKNDQN